MNFQYNKMQVGIFNIFFPVRINLCVAETHENPNFRESYLWSLLKK